MNNQRTIRVLEYDKIRETLADMATSEPGRALCLSILPTTDERQIESAQLETEEAYDALSKKGAPPLFGIRPQEESFKRLEKSGVLGTAALLALGDLLRASGQMKNYFADEETGFDALRSRTSPLYPMSGLSAEIARIILSEDEIADDATPTLKRIRNAIQRKEVEVKDRLQQYLRTPDQQKKLRELLVTVRDGRYVLPVRADAKGSFPGIVHDQSASKQTVYIEPMAVVNLNNEIRQLYAEEEEEIEKILRELSAICADNVEEFRMNQELMIELDFIFAKGKLASAWHAVRPIVKRGATLSIDKARHPLLDPRTVMPIDLRLGGEFTTLVITGPNTGGKTVTLKTIGLCSMMAQSGLHIPSDIEPKLPIFDQVFSDIGDEQSIEQSLSTFSSHMTNIVEILRDVSQDSLVLFDELGAGTDPIEGAALAMSILETLLERGIHTVATTHYSQLKLYALNTPGVKNASVEFDVQTLRPTYRLQIGLPGKSNAFEISRRLGLPETIIESSRKKISSENKAFEDVLTQIEREQQRAEKEREETERLRAEWHEKQEKLDRLIEANEDKRQKLIDEGKKEAARIVEEAKAQMSEMIELLKATAKGADADRSIAQARQMLREQESAVEPVSKKLTKKTKKVAENLRLGETVRVLTMGESGQLLTLPDKNGQVTVQIGILKVTVMHDEIERAEESKKETGGASMKALLRQKSQEQVSSRLDLRGLRVDEALVKVEQFLDSSILSGIDQVEIIHGKGTGQLRTAISDFVKGHPLVKRSRLGTMKEGGDGVTIVEL